MQKKSKHNVNAGDVFGRLTLTGVTYKKECSDGRRTMYVAKCECGDERGYQLKYLIRGDTKSCGCYRNDMIVKAVTKHSLSKHPLYSVYMDMKRRCYVKNSKAYPDYGARGIIVCEEWLNNIKSFYDWGLENGWQKGLELDRRDNNGNYEPSNCRFITRAVGNTNTRRNINVTAFGETKTATEWSRDRRCKVASRTVLDRIKNGKWDSENAITALPNARKTEFSRSISTVRLITAWGESKSQIEWSEDKRCKVGYSGLKIRLKKGWTPEKAISTPSQL